MGFIFNKATEHGYMGPKFQVMFEVGRTICLRYLRNGDWKNFIGWYGSTGTTLECIIWALVDTHKSVTFGFEMNHIRL